MARQYPGLLGAHTIQGLLIPILLSKLRFDGLQMATLRTIGKYRGKQQLYFTQSPEMGS